MTYTCGHIYENFDQGSPNWHAVRCGKVTASRMADVMATIKSGEAALRKNYRAELVCQRLTGIVQSGYVSPEMQWGADHEADARMAYAYPRGLSLTPISFVDHPTLQWSGASPDCAVGDKGLVEIKCPNTATHIETLLGKSVPEKYVLQMQWQMACSGRVWCDFVSFDPRLPDHLQLFVKRVLRNDALIGELETEATKFLGEVQKTVNALDALEKQEAA